MALVALASVKGAPGVSTAALSLAATWNRQAVLAELDPDGGDVRFRLRAEDGRPLAADIGLVSFAESVVEEGVNLLDHVQSLPGGLQVMVGVSAPEQSEALDGLWTPVCALLDAVPDVDVIADCGRLSLRTPVEPALAHASALLVLTRPTVDGVAHLRARLRSLSVTLPTYVAVVTGAEDRRSAREVQLVLDDGGVQATVLGAIAYDPDGAGTLAGEWSGRLNSSPLMRTARELGHKLRRALAEVEAMPA